MIMGFTDWIRRILGFRNKPLCGGCSFDDMHEEPAFAGVSSGIPSNPKARTFYYSMMDKDSTAFAFKGMTNLQTKDLIRKAMQDLSMVCGARFLERDSYPNIRFYFKNEVDYGAIGVYAGGGAVWMSRSRSVSAFIAVICIQHEVGHFLNLWANPRSDSWGHCPDRTCIYNINGTGQQWCPACRKKLIEMFGPLNVRDIVGKDDGPSLHPMPKI